MNASLQGFNLVRTGRHLTLASQPTAATDTSRATVGRPEQACLELRPILLFGTASRQFTSFARPAAGIGTSGNVRRELMQVMNWNCLEIRNGDDQSDPARRSEWVCDP